MINYIRARRRELGAWYTKLNMHWTQSLELVMNFHLELTCTGR